MPNFRPDVSSSIQTNPGVRTEREHGAIGVRRSRKCDTPPTHPTNPARRKEKNGRGGKSEKYAGYTETSTMVGVIIEELLRAPPDGDRMDFSAGGGKENGRQQRETERKSEWEKMET